MIDTHCHLTWPGIIEKIVEVLKGVKESNIKCLHTICTKRKDMSKILEIILRFGEEYNIYGSVGVHPCDANIGEFMSKIELIKFIRDNKRIISIGETGLDKFRDYDLNKQIKSFEEHIAAALECDVPLVIHSREAEKETYEILKETKAKGILHCFTGSKEFARKCLDLGLYISFSGILTFKNSHLQDIVKFVPVNRIVVETDAPYLTPEPFRGRKNKPEYVKYVYDKIIGLKQEII